MRRRHAAGAPVVLVADIDRGGAFAHLHGTWSLLGEDDRPSLRGFVLNKFRGDPTLLVPAPADLAAGTGMAYVGRPTVPRSRACRTRTAPRLRAPRPGLARVRRSLPDGVEPRRVQAARAGRGRALGRRGPDELDGGELVVLPGSKHVAADLAWLRRAGFAERSSRAPPASAVLGICGGLQMLGDRIDDPAGVDGNGHGLGLLPVYTRFDRDKRLERVTSRFAPLPEPWAPLTGAEVHGYEIRHGAVVGQDGAVAALPEGRGFVAGSVLGITLHGVLESSDVAGALVGRRPNEGLDAVFDALADAVDEHLDMALLDRLAGVG